MDQEKKSDIEVIAILLPRTMEERVLSFPFLHLMREAYPEAEIHLICDKFGLEILTSLSFSAFYHEFEPEDFRTIFHIHRFRKSMRIGKVDKFYSLARGFKGSFLGWLLRAKSKIGFEAPWVKWFLTTTVPYLPAEHFTDASFRFYEAITLLKIPEKYQVQTTKKFTPVLDHLGAYIAIDVYPFTPGQLDSFWRTFIEMSENRTFVFFSSEEIEKGSILIEEFIKILPLKNRYVHFVRKNWLHLMQMLSHSQGLLAREGFISLLHSYLGGSSIIIYESKDPRISAPFHFFSNWQLIDLNDPSLRKEEAKSLLAPRHQVAPEILFERVEGFFRHVPKD
jgi:ADP-heptose:LPS heptosyltransferase